MGAGQAELSGPDFERGVPLAELPEGKPVVGHAHGEGVVVVRRGEELFAVGAACTHYGGPLAEGIVSGDTIRCPWHHACFSLRTGEALTPPALNPVPCHRVEKRDGKVFLTGKATAPAVKAASGPKSVVIVGGGPAGQAAAEMLRRRGHVGAITMVSADASPPVDRPNLSKDYLAGNAPEEWIPLRPPEFFEEQKIDLRLGTRVTKLDPKARRVTLDRGGDLSFDALLLATGADPVRLSVPGAELPHVGTLRSLADSRALIARAKDAKRAVVLGASFIGLEAAASLRARGLEVDVVAPEAVPLERVMGPELGAFVRALHEEHGVRFHLGQTAKSIDAKKVTLSNGEVLAADMVVVGIGVRPNLELAEKAGLSIDRGVVVNAHLETSAQGIWAAGDIARWPDPHTGSAIRVEHWVVAERHGQIAARNMLGEKVPCDFPPFFWSQHYDVTLSYVGHAERWDRIDIAGSLAKRDATAAFRSGDRTLAVVTVGRDQESLRAEVAFEKRESLAAFGR